MCITRGVFVIICLLLGVMGGLFVAVSATPAPNRGVLRVVGCIALVGSISGLQMLQHDIACHSHIQLY